MQTLNSNNNFSKKSTLIEPIPSTSFSTSSPPFLTHQYYPTHNTPAYKIGYFNTFVSKIESATD